MSLRLLLPDPHRSTFLADYCQRQPFALAGYSGELAKLGQLDLLERLISTPAADFLVVQENELRPEWRPVSLSAALELLDRGCTLLCRHAERHEAALANFARELAAEFAADIDLQFYCTPPGQRGFSWHYDAEEVFYLQTAGRKEFSLRKNTVNPWPVEETLPSDMHYEREIMPLMKCSLEANDWLYIPSGYWHRATAGEELSLSLSIGVMPRTGLDLLTSLRRELTQSLLWRQRLPVLGSAALHSDEELLGELKQLAQRWSDDLRHELQSDRFLLAFLARMRTPQPELDAPPVS